MSGMDATEEEELALTIKSEDGCGTFSPADEEESFEREEEEDSGKPQCSCRKKAMSFARRFEGEMTLELIALLRGIVLRKRCKRSSIMFSPSHVSLERHDLQSDERYVWD